VDTSTLDFADSSAKLVLPTVGEGYVFRYNATRDKWDRRPLAGTGTPRVRSTTNATTMTPDATYEWFKGSGTQSTDITIANPTGTKVDGQRLTIRLKNSSASVTRAVTWGSEYRAVSSATLPTVIPTTATTPSVTWQFHWNSDDSTWDYRG
jgi:hypothetical protein